MQIQRYAKKFSTPPGVASLEQKRVEKKTSERSALLKELGLVSVTAAEELAEIPYPELFGEDLAVLQRYCPTRYLGIVSDGTVKDDGAPLGTLLLHSALQRWSSYHFDTIPVEALREIKKAKDSGYFPRIEIWTTEQVNLDPVAVGRVDVGTTAHFFPIVRWGDGLLTVEEMKKEIEKRPPRNDLNSLAEMMRQEQRRLGSMAMSQRLPGAIIPRF